MAALPDIQTYLIRVLRHMERRLIAEHHHREGQLVTSVIRQLSGSANPEDAFERLYMVEGMEQFALGLMWLASKKKEVLNGIHDEVMRYEVDALHSLLFDEADAGAETADEPSPGTDSPVSSMNRFNRFVADIRRRVTAGGKFKGFDEDILARIQDEAAMLRTSADALRNPEISRFSDALADFIQFVTAHRLFSDIRVLNLISNANLTLQTVVGSGIAADRDALERTIGLLSRPAEIFDQPSEHLS